MRRFRRRISARDIGLHRALGEVSFKSSFSRAGALVSKERNAFAIDVVAGDRRFFEMVRQNDGERENQTFREISRN